MVGRNENPEEGIIFSHLYFIFLFSFLSFIVNNLLYVPCPVWFGNIWKRRKKNEFDSGSKVKNCMITDCIVWWVRAWNFWLFLSISFSFSSSFKCVCCMKCLPWIKEEYLSFESYFFKRPSFPLSLPSGLWRAQTDIKGSQSIWWILHPILNQFQKRKRKKTENERKKKDDDFYVSLERYIWHRSFIPIFVPFSLFPSPPFPTCEDTDDLCKPVSSSSSSSYFSLSLFLSVSLTFWMEARI